MRRTNEVSPLRSSGPARDRTAERGAGVVEWLGISALSVGMLVVLFTAMEALGLDVVTQIRASLGL